MSREIQFPQRLRMLRGKRSQAEMASYLNVTQASYSYWETGKRQPKLDLLAEICQRLNVSTDWILGLNNAPQMLEPSIGEKLAMLTAQADKAKEYMDEVMNGIRSLEENV